MVQNITRITMAYYFSSAAAPVDTENKPTHHSTKPVTTSHAIGKQNFTIFINAKKVVRNYVMVVLSMSGFLIEKLDIVRRLVCGGWYMKRGMVSFACCAECTIVKIHLTIKRSLTRSLL